MTREQAIKVAKRAARQNPPSYYTGDDFEPHEWVIEAIMDAFKRGFAHGTGIRDWDY